VAGAPLVPVESSVVGATEMRFRVGTDAWGESLPYADASEVLLPESNGSYEVSAEYKSSTGDVLQVTHSIRLKLLTAKALGRGKHSKVLKTAEVVVSDLQTQDVEITATGDNAISPQLVFTSSQSEDPAPTLGSVKEAIQMIRLIKAASTL
jgi:hypothetical protein